MLAERLDVALSGVWLAAQRPWLGRDESATFLVKCSPSPLEKLKRQICRSFKPTPGLEPGTPSLRVKCSTS
jgi:hypothetical protein